MSGVADSLGASVNHDHYGETLIGDLPQDAAPGETTGGLYAQYTYKPHKRLTVMPGLRWDYSSIYGAFVTPRLHIKYMPWKALTLRASAGKGYRTPHAMAENAPLLASGRSFATAGPLKQEEAWNFGLSASLNLTVVENTLELNAEYYYTDFQNQMVVNVDAQPGTPSVSFENLDGRSYSHTLQIDATYPFFDGFSAMVAFRLNDARSTTAVFGARSRSFVIASLVFPLERVSRYFPTVISARIMAADSK